MITSSGVRCDVCGKFILPLDPDERVHEFSLQGVKNMLHCDNKCKALLADLMQSDKDWRKLPDGPIRKLFEEQEADKPQSGGRG